MRWTDAPARAAWRTVATWSEAMAAEIDRAALAGLVERARGVKAGRPPIVALARSALASAWDHVGHSALERGGLLLGQPLAHDADGASPALVHVRAAVAGLDDQASEFSLRLNTGVWDAARASLRPGEVVVGWFHSHPGIGAFFSDTDRRTQAGFFPHLFSLGWVIDPQRREQAWFAGPSSEALALEGVVLVG